MKKRILSFLLAVCLSFSALPIIASASSKPSILYGDVKSDGAINMKDVLAIKQYIAGYENSIDQTASDVTSDGNIDARDLLLLKKFIAGWDVLLGPPFYTITFNTNGGSAITPVKVRQSDLLPEVPHATKANAIFLGWYTDSALTTPFYGEDAVLSNVTLYAKFAPTKNQEQFADNTFTLSEQTADLSFNIASTDISLDAKAILAGITLENIGNTDYISLSASGTDGNYIVTADGGFIKGASYKLTLNDSTLTFVDKAPSYRICTFTIAKDEVIDIALNNDLIYIKGNELTAITLNGEPVTSLSVAVIGNTDTAVTGTFNYENAETLMIGDSVCVYENIKPADRDTVTDYSADHVAYIEVTAINGTTVSYKSANADEIISMPDTLPVSEDELTAYDASGSFSAEASSLDFSGYTELGLDAKTTVDTGDYLVITENDKDIVYGKVASIATTAGIITVTFTVTTADAIQNTTLDYYTKTDADGNQMIENTDVPLLEKQIEAQTIKSGFANSALHYLASAATKTDGFQKISGVEDFVMTAADGSVVDPTKIKPSQFGIGYEGENITVDATISTKTEHFGKGLRIAVKVSGEIAISAGEDNEVVIELSATFVEEVKMSFNADGGAVWKLWKGFLPYISDYKMNANIDVYNYTGISVAAKVSLREKDDGSIDISDELEKLMNSQDEEEISAGVQNLFEAYGDMLDNETGYVNIVDKTLTETKAWVDPFCIIAYAYKVDFVVGANINVALGCNFEYMSGTRYNFWFAIKAKSAGNSSMDLIDETYGFQFYAMGHLGIRAGLQFEFAVGLFSTDLASIGLVSEVGAYVELFGYFFYEYDSVRAAGTAQGVTSSKMCGALYLEFGIYLEISFKAQAANEKFVYNPTLYEHQWPLLWAGERINVYDFGYAEPAETDTVVIKDVTTSPLPESIRYMSCLDLKEGDLSVNEYDLNNFYYNLSNKYFALDPNTGIVTVTVPEDVRYMECDLTVTWKTQKLAFSKDDLTRTIHLVWTNLTDTELKEKYDVCVKAGNNIVWSTRVNRGETPVLPTEAEILSLIGYDKNIVNGTNLKFTGYTGYGAEVATPVTHNQTFSFGVSEREYKLTVNGVENEDGTLASKEFTTKFGENFDLSSLANTGTRIAGKTYTRYFNTECSLASGKAVTDRIDSTFATQLINGTYSYTATYVDNSCKVTYLFGTVDGLALGTATETVEKGTIPSFDYSDYVLNQGGGYIVKDWDNAIGKVTADTVFTAFCCLPTGEKHTISFETNGGNSITPIQRYEGAAIAAPVVPTKTGYTFENWYSNEQRTNVYTFGKMTGNSFTLYANWTANAYTATLDPTGGECSTNDMTVTYDSTYGTLPTTTRYGFAFSGWFTVAEGGKKIDSATKITATENYKLFAHWVEKVKVTGVVTTTQTYTYDTTSHPFILSGTELTGFTIKYKKAGDSDWSENCVNAGAYAVMITREENEVYKAYEKVLTDALIINKASRTINAPASASSLFRNISVSPVSEFIGYGDGDVEYSASTTNTAPAEGWSTSLSMVNLKGNTPYYVFARVNEGTNYLAATSAASINTVTTGVSEIAAPINFSLGVKTADVTNAGTDSKVYIQAIYFDGIPSVQYQMYSDSDDFEKNSYRTYTLPLNDPSILGVLYPESYKTMDPWMICGMNLGTDGGGTASEWNCDYIDIGIPAWSQSQQLGIYKKFDNTYLNFYTNMFKRTITSAGDFGAGLLTEYDVTGTNDENIVMTYDGTVTDQYGTYNAYAHDDAPQLYVATSKTGYSDCFSYNINSMNINRAALYQKMLNRGETQLVFTISLKFKSRSSNTTEITKTVTINRK